MKKILWLLLLGFNGVVLANHSSFLFFQTAPHASIDKLHKNNYLITLNNTPEFVNYFAEKPIQLTGAVALSDFISLWNNKRPHSFAKNPPNAAIVMISDRGVRQQVMAVVSNPSHSTDTVTYQISALNNKPLQTGKLKYIVLFFNNIAWDPE